MSITQDEAYHAEEFHIAHAWLPCEIWTRAGVTYAMPENGFFVPITHYNEFTNLRDWHRITRVNAGDFHTPADCPHARSDQSDNSPDPDQPVLAGDDGRDVLGYDAEGYDAEGYDAEGYDSEGLDRNGCNRAGDRYCADCDEAPCECGTTICDRCGDREPDEDIIEISGLSVCDDCRGRYYSYCDYCEDWYPDEDSYEHDHSGQDDGCCPELATGFTIRNDGCEPLRSGQWVTVSLPAGTISAEGLDAIRSYLAGQYYGSEDGEKLYQLSCDLDALGDQWQAKDGNYTRRLSRLAYQRYQLKLSPETMSQVGCIARDHSKEVSTEIEVSRALNEPASYWYHADSCWWQSYSEGRCALKSNGGFGIRSFREDGRVSGRAWVLPLRLDESGNLVPTFDTMTPDAFVVFNGYGELSSYAPARILAHMAGWTYRKISYGDSTMYVNSGGYLIAPEDLAEEYTDGSLRTSLPRHSCLYETEKVAVNA